MGTCNMRKCLRLGEILHGEGSNEKEKASINEGNGEQRGEITLISVSIRCEKDRELIKLEECFIEKITSKFLW
jgi:hypothetical protein